jgi:hypothetical protein
MLNARSFLAASVRSETVKGSSLTPCLTPVFKVQVYLNRCDSSMKMNADDERLIVARWYRHRVSAR